MTVALARIAPRSFLFAPGDSPRLLTKVGNAGADAVVLDLEDAVSSLRKEIARQEVSDWLGQRNEKNTGPEIWVRLNTLMGEAWEMDLEAVLHPGLFGIRVPKAESAEDLRRLDVALNAREVALGLPRGSIALTCTIESARGLVAVHELAMCPRVVQLAFGEVDFLADIGAAPVPEATLFARSQLVLASRIADLAAPIAPVYTQLEDLDGLRQSSEAARDLGFGGRSCIHPKQLDVIHQVFTPSVRAVEEARDVVAAWEDAGGGAARQGARFVDEAVVRRARAILARAVAYEEEARR